MTPFISFLLVASSTLPIGQKIIQTAMAYDVDPILAVRVAQCESNFNPSVYGDKGKAFGLYQFWKGTFDRFEKESQAPDLEYKNADHQIELAMWAIANDRGSHWTCWRKLQGSKK